LSYKPEGFVANRHNWDDRTAVHLESRLYDVEGWLREGRGPRPEEVEALGDAQGLRLLHLQCHFGQDSLSLARAGARVTGLDFSPAAIGAARDLAERAGLADRATFVCADVYSACAALRHQTYDIVYVSLGALCWLPSVDRWAAQVAALVAPGGRFYLHDGHPLSGALDNERLEVRDTYFEEEAPSVDDSGVTYTDGDRRLEHCRTYQWSHSLGETVTTLIRHGLRLEWLREHPWTAWRRFPWMVEGEGGHWLFPPGVPRVPLSFTLLATRPEVVCAERPGKPEAKPGGERPVRRPASGLWPPGGPPL
jgi:SAM-dependent methyltransferase